MFDRWDIGNFTGLNKSHCRVTVEPDWFLNLSTSMTSGSIGKGPSSKKTPFRWFQRKDNSQIEIELPNVLSVNTDRSVDTDAATCDISISNQWMNDNDTAGSLVTQLGEPGYFTWDHGISSESQARWNQSENAWRDILIPNALIRTYQGYGGYNVDGTQKSITDCLVEGALTLTGMWLIDEVTYGTDGKLSIRCRDMAKLLLDQTIFPPLIPSAEYPLEYCRWVYESYDAKFNARQPTVTRSTGAMIPTYMDSSTDRWYGHNYEIHGHKGTDSTDGNGYTWAMSVGNGSPDRPFCTDWFEYGGFDSNLSQVYINPWGGNYTMYISVMENGVWQDGGEGLIPYDMTSLIGNNYDEYGVPRWVDTEADIPYIMKTGVGWETPAWYQLPRVFNAQRIRITFRNHLLSEWGQWYYRCGIREIMVNATATTTTPPSVPKVFSVAPYRNGDGYWAVVDDGQVFAFGDARVQTKNNADNIDNTVIAMYPHPDCLGYWLLQSDGRVHSYGSATHHGNATDFIPGHGATDYIDMACTPSGNGYWLIRRNGELCALGDAVDYGTVSSTIGLREPVSSYIATGIESHPTLDGYWITNGNGEVTAFGSVPDYGSWSPARHDLFEREWVRGIVRTKTGDGYWLLGGGAHIHSAGAAPDHGVNVRPDSVTYDELSQDGYSKLTWQMAPNENGTGAWVLQVDGTVLLWGDADGGYGQPGGTGTIRKDGNYLDYSDIVREMLLWCGWWFAEETPSVEEKPEVYGNIEDTGIYASECIPADKWDKKQPIEVIHNLKEIVGYNFYIDDEGGARFEAPNWWSIGNYLQDGTPFDFIPEIDEQVNLLSYGTKFSDVPIRSEIVVSTEAPEKGNYTTKTTRIQPNTAYLLRGMVKPAIWTNGLFDNMEEQEIMAELIAMQIWFQQRQGNVTIPANPCLQIDDQVRIYERVTGESYVHYIRGISTSHDLTTGEYKMTLTTHWLGNEDDWAITAESIQTGGAIGLRRIGLSEALVTHLSESESTKLKYSWMGFEAQQVFPAMMSTAPAPPITDGAANGE